MNKIIVIAGQTASGKTSLSLEIASKIKGEIISADAYQVYKELNIVTDKIIDTKGINHYLINTRSINENYSVCDFQKEARAAIDEITSNGNVPIIVGGTGLYIKALIYDYNFNDDNGYDHSFEDKYKNLSNEELYKILLNIDPEACKTIHQNNRRRVLRAIEIYESSGITKSKIINNQSHKPLYDALIISIDDDAININKKIDDRIDEMFNNGLIDEIKNNKTTSTASKAIGYKEINDYLDGSITLEKAKELMKIHTHQYAKRQRTWLRHQLPVTFIKKDENLVNNALSVIEEFLGK